MCHIILGTNDDFIDDKPQRTIIKPLLCPQDTLGSIFSYEAVGCIFTYWSP